jgi:hypothetical protein
MTIRKRFILGCVTLISLGFVFHFLYEFLGKAKYIAVFFPVNESVWEHMKLLFLPVVIWVFIERFVINRKVRSLNYAIRAAALVICLLILPMTFYLCKSGFGAENVFVDIGIFILDCILFQAIVYLMEERGILHFKSKTLGIAVICVISLLFILFTFLPPHIPLFFDYSHNLYGMT